MRRNELIRLESAGSSFLTMKFFQLAAAAVLVAGIVAGRLEAILLGAFAVATVNVARIWCRLAARTCGIEAGLSRSRLYPGEETAIRVEARNRGLLPIWVRVAVPDSEGPVSLLGDRRLAPEARPPLLAGQTGLLAFQEVVWQPRVVAGRRGVYDLGPVRLEVGDLLGFFRRRHEEPDRLQLIVYPRLVPVALPPLPVREFFGPRKARTPVEDPARGAGTRDYLGGRPARHIHWKASARLDRLQEKVFEPTAQASILFLLDALSFPEDDEASAETDGVEPTHAERSFEGALEVVASLAVALERHRVPVGLETNGTLQGGSQRLVPPGRGPYQLSRLLEMLARLTRAANGAPHEFSASGLVVGATTTCLYVCFRLTRARALAIETLRLRLRSPFIVLFAEPSRPAVPAQTAAPSWPAGPAEADRLEQETTARWIEHLAAAGISALPLSDLVVGGERRV